VGVPILLMPSWFLFAAYIVLFGQPLLRDEVGSNQAYAVAVAFVTPPLGVLAILMPAMRSDQAGRTSAMRLLAASSSTRISDSPFTSGRHSR